MSIEKMRIALEALEEINKYSKPPNGICLPAGIGRYQDEPEIQCGIFCEAAKLEYSDPWRIKWTDGL